LLNGRLLRHPVVALDLLPRPVITLDLLARPVVVPEILRQPVDVLELQQQPVVELDLDQGGGGPAGERAVGESCNGEREEITFGSMGGRRWVKLHQLQRQSRKCW
jgi:hypothetical protein